MIAEKYQPLLVDPFTKKTLNMRDYIKESNSHHFLDLVPQENQIRAAAGKELYKLWSIVQNNGEQSYNSEGFVGNFSHDSYVPGRKLGEELLKSCGGLFLDIGCGLLEEPIYMKIAKEKCKFIGIDPVAIGNDVFYKERSFDFLRAMGDFLPFRDECFDGVVFSSTLDHHLSPENALTEAYRVLRPGGYVFIVETTRAKDLNYYKWLLKKSIFGAAIYNKFHCWAFTQQSLQNIIQKAGFKIQDTFYVDRDEFFISAQK